MIDLLLSTLLSQEGRVVPTVTVSAVLVGMLVLAALDVWRHEVEDFGILVLFGVAVIGMQVEGISGWQWTGALVVGVAAFWAYLGLGKRGMMGGGDVKLSPIPAFALGVLNPLAGLWWVVSSIAIQQLIFLAHPRAYRGQLELPNVPAMTLAAVLATVIFTQ